MVVPSRNCCSVWTGPPRRANNSIGRIYCVCGVNSLRYLGTKAARVVKTVTNSNSLCEQSSPACPDRLFLLLAFHGVDSGSVNGFGASVSREDSGLLWGASELHNKGVMRGESLP